MKIAIIGGGWVGCHLASILKDQHNIILYEKNDEIFNGTSFNNQNRLHYGYHYARNYETRNLCRTTFDRFINDYGFCVSNIEKNFYCVPKKLSLIDLNTYLKIFDKYPSDLTIHNFNNTEGCILTNEKHINFEKIKSYFESDLEGLIKYENVDKEKLNEISKNSDLVIDATNNFMGLINTDFFYELTITLIYNKINETIFDSVTFVDGELFSIYPYKDNKFTLTDVKLTPLRRFSTIDEIDDYKKIINDDFILKKVSEFEDRVKVFMPKFNDYFEYDSYFLSIKSKINDESDSRYPVIKQKNNIVSCFTGKIQGIYIIEDYILNIINNDKRRIISSI
jgi:hypothetical protein